MGPNPSTMKARKAIKRALSKISEESPIGVGCSGGADSLALLAALSTLYKGERASLVHVVIVDHQLQEVTAEVAEATRIVAEEYGFTPHVKRVNVLTTSEGLESDARNARYQAFEEVIWAEGLKAFLLGHTMSDQAEQVMLGLFRGSGTKSISGMPFQRGLYVRPFLKSLTRKDTETACEEAGLSYWLDPHNESDSYTRVRVRKMLLSSEEDCGKSITSALVRTAQIAEEDDAALAFYTDLFYDTAVTSGWRVEVLKAAPAAVRKRAYQKQLLSLGVAGDGITFTLLQRVEDFVENWSGQKEVYFSGGVRVARNDNRLLFFQS